MSHTIEIPAFLSHLRTYRGLPVPFSQFWIDNDTPDFRIIDQDLAAQCVTEFKCSICGNALGEYAYFVGGPKSFESGYFADPPMHKHCAEFSMKTCPYLNGDRRSYNTTKPITKEHEIITHPGVIGDTKIGMRKAKTTRRSYQSFMENGSLLIHVEKWAGLPVYEE